MPYYLLMFLGMIIGIPLGAGAGVLYATLRYRRRVRYER